MAKALFLGLPLHGHTNPSLPLVRALVDRGDEVVYFSGAEFAAAIQRAGARYCPYRAPSVTNLQPMSERTDKMSWFLMNATREVLAHDFDALRAERPDYIITDSVAPWGQWVAQMLGVPVVTSVTTFAVNRHVLALAASRGTRPASVRLALSKIGHVAKAALLRRRLRREHRVRGTSIMGLMFGCSDLNVVYTSRYFQPCAESFDDRFPFIGPSIDLRSATASTPREETSEADLIYVSLGTLFNADSTFYRKCFEAFRELNVRVIMSIGATVTEASVGTPPSNVTVLPWVPQLEVLARASVFVSHGGMNSVSESLYHGVPLVVVPQMGEQELVASPKVLRRGRWSRSRCGRDPRLHGPHDSRPHAAPGAPIVKRPPDSGLQRPTASETMGRRGLKRDVDTACSEEHEDNVVGEVVTTATNNRFASVC